VAYILLKACVESEFIVIKQGEIEPHHLEKTKLIPSAPFFPIQATKIYKHVLLQHAPSVLKGR